MIFFDAATYKSGCILRLLMCGQSFLAMKRGMAERQPYLRASRNEVSVCSGGGERFRQTFVARRSEHPTANAERRAFERCVL